MPKVDREKIVILKAVRARVVMPNALRDKVVTLKLKLKDELEAIDFRLRVGTNMVGVLRAADKRVLFVCQLSKGTR